MNNIDNEEMLIMTPIPISPPSGEYIHFNEYFQGYVSDKSLFSTDPKDKDYQEDQVVLGQLLFHEDLTRVRQEDLYEDVVMYMDWLREIFSVLNSRASETEKIVTDNDGEIALESNDVFLEAVKAVYNRKIDVMAHFIDEKFPHVTEIWEDTWEWLNLDKVNKELERCGFSSIPDMVWPHEENIEDVPNN